ncbi:MAG: purine-nucleoside phosphorylase [Oscillospiraceae bacterium]|nr:purine-nucleoside phosphorylase [Oscillospiraceae bacterium]
MTVLERIEKSTAYIQQKLGGQRPQVGMILGSGLGDYADTLEQTIQIPYGEIPGFLHSTVEGHKGQLVIGRRGGQTILAMQGRFHYYEGYCQQEITIPVRVMKKLGIGTVVITNAAGGVNAAFAEGALMVIADHINYSGQNPLIGKNLDEFGPRFPDMTNVYDPALRKCLIETAAREGIDLAEGVYIMFSGPNYETPAEIRFCRAIGADAVGMSTVPEAIVAAHCGMCVLGISCITNMAAGMTGAALNHEEVMETSTRVKKTFTRVLDIVLSDVLN